MEERNEPELTDPELDALLKEWKTPIAPVRLRASVFPGRSRSRYLRWFAASVRIPVPVVVVMCVVLMVSGWQWGARRERSRGEIQRSLASAQRVFTYQGFSPVAELRPRIIRSDHAAN